MVSRALRSADHDEVIIHTGQHFDANMSEIFFQQMGIPKPSVCLNIANLSHGAMTGRMLEQIEKQFLHVNPDLVVVYGDTNSTLAGALAAAKMNIPIAHVEAGLRSFNWQMPEEINRVLTDRVSQYLFCPTQTAVENLHQEGFSKMPCQIHQTGDVMLDAALFYGQFSEPVKGLDVAEQAYVVATVHRQENTDDPERLKAIFQALDKIHCEQHVVMPIHPRTKQRLEGLGIQTKITLIEPVGCLQMFCLLQHCQSVLTDSGGLQKEAYFFSKPCITLREQTEWVELITAGVNVLVGSNSSAIYGAWQNMRDCVVSQDKMLYGNGSAATEIANILRQ
jgi:UDP-GlcNAc3NAcA epimerase